MSGGWFGIVITTLSETVNWPSLAVSVSTYVPGWLKVTAVVSELELANVTVPPVPPRDQQRLAHGPLTEYSQFGQGIEFGEATPRAGNDSGGGQPGWIVKCKGWETDPNAYVYFITQAAVWGNVCDLIGKPEWKTDPGYATPNARLDKIPQIFDTIEEWTKTLDKFEVMDKCTPLNIPCGPILSMKELAEEPSLRATGTVVEVDHPTRGPYLTVGNPVKLSDSSSDVVRSPLLGEHTQDILRSVVGYGDEEIAAAQEEGAARQQGHDRDGQRDDRQGGATAPGDGRRQRV